MYDRRDNVRSAKIAGALNDMRFELFIAARYLKAKRRQAVVGVITLISIAGVAAGVASLIVALAITNGMRRDLQERLLGSTAHVELMRVQSDGIRDWRALTDRLRQLPHVTAAAPGLYGQVLISRGARSGGALSKAFFRLKERTVSDLAGEGDHGIGAATGRGRQQRHNGSQSRRTAPGDWLRSGRYSRCEGGLFRLITSPQGELTPLGIVPKYQRFRIAGIFRSGLLSIRLELCVSAIAAMHRRFSANRTWCR